MTTDKLSIELSDEVGALIIHTLNSDTIFTTRAPDKGDVSLYYDSHNRRLHLVAPEDFMRLISSRYQDYLDKEDGLTEENFPGLTGLEPSMSKADNDDE